MNVLPHGWAARALWLMLAVSAGWITYLFTSNYGSCRAHGSEQLGCFVIALFLSCMEALLFAFLTIINLLIFILP
jgi:hypothetical protein